MKRYTVFYIIKANGLCYLKSIDVNADTALDACALCRKTVKAKTGKNAFRPTTRIDRDDLSLLRQARGYVIDLNPDIIAKIEAGAK